MSSRRARSRLPIPNKAGVFGKIWSRWEPSENLMFDFSTLSVLGKEQSLSIPLKASTLMCILKALVPCGITPYRLYPTNGSTYCSNRNPIWTKKSCISLLFTHLFGVLIAVIPPCLFFARFRTRTSKIPALPNKRTWYDFLREQLNLTHVTTVLLIANPDRGTCEMLLTWILILIAPFAGSGICYMYVNIYQVYIYIQPQYEYDCYIL